MTPYLTAAVTDKELLQSDVSERYASTLESRIDINLRFSIATSLERIASALETSNRRAARRDEAEENR